MKARRSGKIGATVTPDAPRRVIRLFGELDLHSAREMSATLSQAVGDISVEPIVDLRRVTFMDSTALGALVKAAEQLRNQGRPLAIVVEPGGQVDGLLDVSGLAGRFEILSEPPETDPGSISNPAAAA